MIPLFSVNGTSYTPTIPLADGHNYIWAVQAYNSSGLGSNTANVSFTVSVPGGGTGSLGTPTLSGPSGAITSTTPTFQWSAVGGAVGYGLYIEDTSGSGAVTPPPVQVSGTSYTPTTALTNGHTYLWWVMAYADNVGDVSQPSLNVRF